ncbi:hypothetical protein Dsin_027004 [Dipteronia sinensis]|uniref:Transmembrane protein n=1 Tax=Dipteronia sinensis TaxID=43782 RepID=A0AAE0DZS6_9ROSI|nr:hypothetical protein Dsin_027004 [Dipteronia sinensis]
MSTPVLEQQPPPVEATQQAFTAHSGYGSVGPVIVVLAVITILGVIAAMIGRLCSGRPIAGHGGQYDFEGWVERKCSTCIDGRVAPPPSRPGIPVAETVLEEAPQEIIKQQQQQEAQQKSNGKQQASSSESRF